jgi:hypothetical protein
LIFWCSDNLKKDNMLVKLGLGSLVAGVAWGIFTAVALFMGRDFVWIDLTIAKIIGEENSSTIIGLINIDKIQNYLNFFIYDLPLFGVVVCISILLLVISLFVRDH